jgi:DNA helicase II / ATP-dependent DNA helicase PcrA
MKDFVLSGNQQSPNLNIDYENELNAEQLRVVAGVGGPTLVLAGAGSGKTRTITYRVAWLLEHGVPTDRMLLLTFTNRAAKEMMVRVEGLLKSYPSGLWSGTFHSIANRMLRMYGSQTGFGSDFSILDEDDANDLMKMCIKELRIDTKAKRFPSVGVLRSMISYSANARIPLKEVVDDRAQHFGAIFPEIQMVAERYASAKRTARSMDFDDLLLQLLILLQENQMVREQLANRFQFILVDEFQDTNIIQSDIVDLLASVHRNVLVVGDDAQSIYSFRAAEIRNILDFPKRYTDAQTFRLVTNYRSTPEILHVANAVIANNTEQFEKELVSARSSGDKPSVVPASDAREEGQYVVEQILGLLDEGYELKNIAVLFRAAFHSQAVEFELMKRAIPYEYRGGMKFFERAHIKDAVSHLRLLRNGRDVVAWLRALQIQPGLGLTTSQKIAEQMAQYESAREAIDRAPKLSARAAEGFRHTTNIVRAMLAAPLPSEAVRAFASHESYRLYLEAEYPNFRDRLDDLEQLAVFAEQYRDLGDFLDAMTLAGDFSGRIDTTEAGGDRQEESENKLILSTIHQAKGLEWDAVFVIHCAGGMFPSDRSMGEANGLEEERRLFYVAATRSRSKLYFTYPLTTGFESIDIREPSPFIQEIPMGMTEMVRLRRSLPSWAGEHSFRSSNARRSTADALDSYDEPTIVLDDMGETVIKKEVPRSFLGNY